MKNPTEEPAKLSLRQRAEGLLKNRQRTNISQLSEYEALKLIHELQVHQLELEVQNEELVRTKELAEIASEKYTELYDFAPTGYFTLTKEGEIIDLNLRGAEMLGKERSHLKNKRLGLFVSNSSKPHFNQFVENTFKNLKTESCEITLSLNNAIPIQIYLTGIAKETEEQCLVTAVEITAFKQMETDLIKAKEEAEDNNRLKTAFLQNMSHEIRSPLNAIIGFSDLLANSFGDELKLKKFTKIIEQRSNDLLDIINDILDIAKIESGQLPVYMEDCDLPVLFNELAAQFNEYQQRNNKKHIRLNMHTEDDELALVIVTDKVKLKQIFVNLLTNAFKFTDKGTIEGGCRIKDNCLQFYVTDTGIGIPPDKQKEVFERFTQLKHHQMRTIAGTGLGLSITKGLVSLLGGEILLESEPGNGSTFSFSIPYKLAQLRKVPLIVAEPKEYYFDNKTILLVEDDLYNAIYLTEILANKGLTIIPAKTGKEAIEIALDQKPDLVLMDIGLPDMDGYKAAQQIKLNKPGLKIIAQTAYAASCDKHKAFENGFNDYISKPIKVDMLLKMVSTHLK